MSETNGVKRVYIVWNMLRIVRVCATREIAEMVFHRWRRLADYPGATDISEEVFYDSLNDLPD